MPRMTRLAASVLMSGALTLSLAGGAFAATDEFEDAPTDISGGGFLELQPPPGNEFLGFGPPPRNTEHLAQDGQPQPQGKRMQAGGQGFGKGQGGPGGGQMREKMMKELGLTEAQQAEFKKIHEANKAQADSMRKQIGEKRKALMEYMAGPDATESGALAKSRELATLQQQMGDLRIKTFFQIKSKMTPEQQQKMRAMRGEMKGKMDQFRQKRQQAGGGQFKGKLRGGANGMPPEGSPPGEEPF